MNAEQQPSSFVSERHQNPAILSATPKRENFIWAASLAGITVLLFVILIVMQWFDSTALDIA